MTKNSTRITICIITNCYIVFFPFICIYLYDIQTKERNQFVFSLLVFRFKYNSKLTIFKKYFVNTINFRVFSLLENLNLVIYTPISMKTPLHRPTPLTTISENTPIHQNVIRENAKHPLNKGTTSSIH